jgi:hypothetical protein
MTAPAADVLLTGGGNIYLFILETPAAKAWVEENVSDDRHMLGRGLAVEHRYAADLAAGMAEDGLTVTSEEVC